MPVALPIAKAGNVVVMVVAAVAGIAVSWRPVATLGPVSVPSRGAMRPAVRPGKPALKRPVALRSARIKSAGTIPAGGCVLSAIRATNVRTNLPVSVLFPAAEKTAAARDKYALRRDAVCRIVMEKRAVTMVAAVVVENVPSSPLAPGILRVVVISSTVIRHAAALMMSVSSRLAASRIAMGRSAEPMGVEAVAALAESTPSAPAVEFVPVHLRRAASSAVLMGRLVPTGFAVIPFALTTSNVVTMAAAEVAGNVKRDVSAVPGSVSALVVSASLSAAAMSAVGMVVVANAGFVPTTKSAIRRPGYVRPANAHCPRLFLETATI